MRYFILISLLSLSFSSAYASTKGGIGFCKVADEFYLSFYESQTFKHVVAQKGFLRGHATCDYILGKELECLGLWQVQRSAGKKGTVVPLKVSIDYQKDKTWNVYIQEPDATKIYKVECELNLKAYEE